MHIYIYICICIYVRMSCKYISICAIFKGGLAKKIIEKCTCQMV